MAVRRGASTEHALGLARRSLGDAKAESQTCAVCRDCHFGVLWPPGGGRTVSMRL